MPKFSWIVLMGGLTFFFFGMRYARHGLQLMAGDRLRLVIAKMTHNRLTSLSLGVLITVILQSSTATLLMLISLAGTGLITLTQAFGVILGADIGTTFVVFLLSVKKIADYALLFVVFGFLLEWIFRESKGLKYFGTILFGFGMVFYGMKLMTQTAGPLAFDPNSRIIFEILSSNPVALLIAAVVMTLMVQTSAATIGMVIALGLAGAVTLETAIPVVLGANIGSCFAALLASLTSDANGRRVAVAHLFVKATGVSLAMPFVTQIAFGIERASGIITKLLPMAEPGVAGNIAIVHLLFNLSLALFFFPFLPLGVWIVSRLVPDRKKKGAFGPKYLDKKALETPPLAFAQAKQEILRIASLTLDLTKDCLNMFDRDANAEELISKIGVRDDKVDLLDREVRFYLAKISRENLTDPQASQQMALLSITSDLEGIGDIISKELAVLAHKKSDKARIFSKSGWKDLNTLHQNTLDNFSLAISAITSSDKDLVRKVIEEGERFNRLEQELRQSHIMRLHVGTPETFETSSIHLDVLGNLKRINAHLVHMAEQALYT